ncbi:hypothetical protein ACFT4A_30765 [Streptomyces sp. NPDC057099]|uniref:hypothetical protein n=1 Tax=Streptomyces sp. NPDC057099 TaxID=3346019 RepID=UPI003635C32A
MDSTATARRLLGNDAAPRPYAELTSGYSGHPPIYAALVAEWEARGHTTPEHRDGQWVSFAAPTESETWTAVLAWHTGPHLGPVVPSGAQPAAGRHPGPVGSAGVHPAPGRFTGLAASSGLRPAVDRHSGAQAVPAGAHPTAGRHANPVGSAGVQSSPGRFTGSAAASGPSPGR